MALSRRERRFEQYTATLDRHFEVVMYSPEPNRCATIFVDITERKRAEAALRQSNRTLEQRVQARTAALNAAPGEFADLPTTGAGVGCVPPALPHRWPGRTLRQGANVEPIQIAAITEPYTH